MKFEDIKVGQYIKFSFQGEDRLIVVVDSLSEKVGTLYSTVYSVLAENDKRHIDSPFNIIAENINKSCWTYKIIPKEENPEYYL